MRFREIRTKEKITDTCVTKKEENEGFRQIKPETDITVEDAKAFWNNMFAGFAKEN
jgi:hypothetical protein